MGRMKRFTAFVLAALLLIGTGYSGVSAAGLPFTDVTSQAEVESTEPIATESETVETESTESGTEVPETEVPETEMPETEVPETEVLNTETPTTEIPSTEETETEEADSEVLESETEVSDTEMKDTEVPKIKSVEQTNEEPAGLLNYLMIDLPVVQTPDTQQIMASVGEEGKNLESAVITYMNKKTKQVFEAPASDILGNFVVFSMEFPDTSWTGTYQIKGITYTIDGITTTTSFKEMGIEAAFGVNQQADTTPDDVFLSDEDVAALSADTSMNVVSMDANGNPASEVDVEEAIANAEAVSPMSRSVKGASVDATGMQSVVVVLDPGHGGTDSGAVGNNVAEKNVNLKIAQYCKEELEKYNGVTVYMTRSGDTYVSLADRVNFAVSKKANVFVSLHNNSNPSSVPNGAEVYYPNSNYNASCGATGSQLAKIIESNLTDLGLASRGIHVRNTENNSKYPDGSLSDYYAVIRESKMNGIPAIIVEHAFISNPSDAANYLSTDAKLKQLGIADAKGIAEYYGLTQGMGFSSIQSKSSTSIQLDWKKQEGVTGYEIQRSTSSASGFATVATIGNSATISWTDEKLSSGVTYYYRIRTYTTSGSKTKYGTWSSVEAGATMARPNIVSIKSENNKKLKLTWDRMENAVNYEVYRSTSKNGTYKKVNTVNGINNYSYIDTVSEGKKYYYKIRCIGMIDNTTVYSDYSEIVSAKTAELVKETAAVAKDSESLRISWKALEGVGGYTIRRSTSKNGKYKLIATIYKPTTSYYDDDTVTADKTYFYKIQTYNYNNGVKGYSGYGSVFSGKTVKKASISTIENLSSTKLKITWKKVSGANGYRVYRSTSKGGSYKRIKTISSGSTTSYTDTDLKSGTTYYYKVRARNKVNGKTGYGTYSTVRSAKAIKKASIATVEGYSVSKITIKWNTVSGNNGYNIYRSTSEKGTYKKIGTAKKNTTSYRDTKLNMNKKYYYKIEAKASGYKKAGTSGLSKVASGYPQRSTAITSITVNESNQLTLNWKKVSGASSYEIYRSTTVDGAYELLEEVFDYKIVTYTDTSATVGTSYFYKIRATAKYDGKNIYTKYSNVMEGKILSAPTNVTAMSISSNQLNIVWSPVEGAVSYEVYRSDQADGTYSLIGTADTSATFSDGTVSEGVTYYYKIRAIDAASHKSGLSSAASGCAVAKISINNLSWNPAGNSIAISWTPMSGKVDGYELYRSSSESVATQTRLTMTPGVLYTDTDVKQGITYYYRVRNYSVINKKTVYGIYSDTRSTNPADYRIMGSSGVGAASLVKMYKNSGKAYPAAVYSSKGAPDIETFCAILYQECEIEGVKPEVLFAQICHETYYLQFGGQVQAAQCNFGGLGATDDGANGGVFADVRTGIRTQIQHMKAYASTDPLKQSCIDTRFNYVLRGKAEYVQQLGSGNWATDPAYAVKMMNYINKIKNA